MQENGDFKPIYLKKNPTVDEMVGFFRIFRALNLRWNGYKKANGQQMSTIRLFYSKELKTTSLYLVLPSRNLFSCLQSSTKRQR